MNEYDRLTHSKIFIIDVNARVFLTDSDVRHLDLLLGRLVNCAFALVNIDELDIDRRTVGELVALFSLTCSKS